MSAALRLLERGCRVTIYEAGDRLGGKAGAVRNGSDLDEHGYHIFPNWYVNTRRLVDELGIADHFVDCTDFHQLRAGEYPLVHTLRNLTSLRWLWHNINAGVLSPIDMFLFFYTTLDLAGQPYRYRAQLDQVTVTGFVRSRFYRTERVLDEMQDLMLKGITVPSYFVSAMTMRKVMQFWVKNPLPMFRILRGDLQRMLIEPIEQRLQAVGCRIFKQERLVKIGVTGRLVDSLTLQNMDGQTRVVPVDYVLIAIPAEKLAALIDDDLYRRAPALASVRYLRAQQMASLNLYLSRRIPGMPHGHTNLLGSQFGLSFIDVSQVWVGTENTVLNIIASDYTPLESLTGAEATAQLISELRRYVPGIADNDIRRAYLQPHSDAPLFRNDVGAWPFRPSAHTELDNLFLAGDCCRSHVDLVSMEGAITTGLHAAEAIRTRLGLAKRVTILLPALYPRWLLVLAKAALLPLVAVAKLVTLFSPGVQGGARASTGVKAESDGGRNDP